MCPIHQHGPPLWNGVLLVMHIDTPKDHFIRLEAWFYVNGTLKYDNDLFFIPQKSLYYEFGSREFQFFKAQSLCALFISTGQLYGVVYLYC